MQENKTTTIFLLSFILRTMCEQQHKGHHESTNKTTQEQHEPQEKVLIDHLFRRYNKVLHPGETVEDPVNMTFGIAYVQLVQLDDKDQVLISNIWVRQKWFNHHLKWDPSEFNNITTLTVSPSLIWLPDIVLYNNAKKGIGAGTMYKFKTKVKIRYDGEHQWYAPTIVRSGCEISITYFPFDEQYCQLTFGSWTFHGGEIDIYPLGESADVKFYQKSTEFDLISTKAKRIVVKYSCCPNITYPNIVFTIHIRRQPGFFLFNVIIPSMVITFFAILTFSSPSLIGERISLAIESFLSLGFLCMMVAESVPVNSDVTPLITKFLITCMSLISAALLFNMVSVTLTTCTKPVPLWLRTLVFVYVGPLVGYCWSTEKQRLHEEAEERRLRWRNNHKSISRVRNGANNFSDAGSRLIGRLARRLERRSLGRYRKIGNEETRKITGGSVPVNISAEEFNFVKSNMKDILSHSTADVNRKLNADFWRCMAQTVDRSCLICFSICFVFVSIVMLLKGYGHQQDVRRLHHDGVNK